MRFEALCLLSFMKGANGEGCTPGPYRGAYFTMLVEGSSSFIQDEVSEIVREPAAWEALWKRHMGKEGEVAPAVNFKWEMAVCVFVGARPTGGYRVSITRMEESADALSLDVHVELSAPAAWQAVTQAITQPYHCARAPRSERSLQLVHTEASQPAQPLKFMVMLRADAVLTAVVDGLKALDTVDHVQVLKTLRMAIVSMDRDRTDAAAAEVALSAVHGVKTVEQDAG